MCGTQPSDVRQFVVVCGTQSSDVRQFVVVRSTQSSDVRQFVVVCSAQPDGSSIFHSVWKTHCFRTHVKYNLKCLFITYFLSF